MSVWTVFSLPVQMYRAFALPMALAVAFTLASVIANCLSFYVMGKALSGELSCMRTGLVE